MRHKLNPDIIEVRLSEREPCILKLGKTIKFIKLSLREYEVLKKYSIDNNTSETIAFFQNKIEITETNFKKLIHRALCNDILIEENTAYKPKDHISFSGVGLTLMLRRKSAKLEILNIDLTHTAFERVIEKIAGFILLLLTLFTLYVIFDLRSTPLHFKKNYIETLYKVPYRFSHLLPFVFICAVISTFIHESGHYLAYKTTRGKTSIFGFGLQYFFLPVFYTKVLIGLIASRKKRIFINVGGMLFDVFQVFFILYFTEHFHLAYPTISFLLYLVLISVIIRSLFNLNVFLSGSDGYFILQDFFNIHNLREEAYKKTKEIFSRNRKIDYLHVLGMLFVIFNILSIIILLLFIFIPLILHVLP